MADGVIVSKKSKNESRPFKKGLLFMLYKKDMQILVSCNPYKLFFHNGFFLSL